MVMAVIGIVILLLPFGITAQGYLPPDDVLRHAAFGVTNRTWGEILIGRPEALFDQSPGWHVILRTIHKLTGCSPEGLATLSIVGMLMIFLLIGHPYVKRWESWAMALGMFFLADPALIKRFTLGRPFILTSVIIVVLLGDSREKQLRPWWCPRHGIWLALAAISAWVHGSWYLLLMAPCALLLAGRFQEAVRMGTILIVGVLLGGIISGHPLRYLSGEITHLLSALESHSIPSLVMELGPGHQPLLPLGVVALVALPSFLMGLRPWGLKDPVLLFALITWVLGYFYVWRFYLDFCFPLLAIWVAWRLDEIKDLLPKISSRRWISVLFAAGLLIVATLPNRSGRWSVDGSAGALDAHIPNEAILLPEPGGVAYSNSMQFFYQTFFRNPNGDWRYILGYEPGLMNCQDRAVYFALSQGSDPNLALAPWIAKMTRKDRMILYGPSDHPPPISSLAWSKAGRSRWSGRLSDEHNSASR